MGNLQSLSKNEHQELSYVTIKLLRSSLNLVYMYVRLLAALLPYHGRECPTAIVAH